MAEPPAAPEPIEDRLARLPVEAGLPPEAEEEFRRRRSRIHNHHHEWRRGMPALDELFDDDSHRAKALAGSLATELERTLELWNELDRRRARPIGVRAWSPTLVSDWLELSRNLAGECQWGDQACAIFELVLTDLSVRAVARAEAGERQRADRIAPRMSAWRRFANIAGRLLQRVFRPPPRGA